VTSASSYKNGKWWRAFWRLNTRITTQTCGKREFERSFGAPLDAVHICADENMLTPAGDVSIPSCS
jgi:hypothetical protein